MSYTQAPTTQDVILSQIAATFVANVPGLTSSTCYAVDRPILPANAPGQPVVQISAAGGTFDRDNFEGGGKFNCREDSVIAVTMWSYVQLDPTGHAEATLYQGPLGLTQLKTAILKAAVNNPIQNVGGVNLLISGANCLEPIDGGSPEPVPTEDGDITMWTLLFAAPFQWLLT